jgi:hypothetical protein
MVRPLTAAHDSGAPSRASAFKQRDLTRALKGAKAGGVSVTRIEIDPNGKIVMMAATATPPAGAGDSWDDFK